MAAKKTTTPKEETPKAETKKVIPTAQLTVEGKKYQFKAFAYYNASSQKVLVEDVLENPDEFKEEIAALLATEGQKILVEV